MADGGPATPGPTREQAELLAEKFGEVISWYGDDLRDADDRVGAVNQLVEHALALFGRSAPEPPPRPSDSTPTWTVAAMNDAQDIVAEVTGRGAPEPPETQR